jgi:hypothetical protein
MASKKNTKPKSNTSAANNTPSASATPAGLSKEEQNSLQEMLQLAKLEYMKSLKARIVKEKHREIDSLDQQIKEFLGPYMLIGYDLNNQPVEIVSAENPAHYDALLERFRRVMFKINQNIVNSDGQDPYGNNGSTD